MSQSTISDLLNLLRRLKAARIYYELSDATEGAILVEVSVPGERWEVEVHEDGRISTEVFVSSRGVQGQELLEELFARFSD
jgi:hypothetical protein